MKKLLLVVVLLVVGTGLWAQSVPQKLIDIANTHEGNKVTLGKLFEKEKQELRNKFLKKHPDFPRNTSIEESIIFLTEMNALLERQSAILFIYLTYTELWLNIEILKLHDLYGTPIELDHIYNSIDRVSKEFLKSKGFVLPE